MQHQYRALDVFRIIDVRSIQRTVERHRRLHGRTRTRKLQRAATTETETERGQFRRIDSGLTLALQLLERHLHALAQQRPIVLQRHHCRACLIVVLRTNRLTIEIRDQHHVALGRDRLGDLLGTGTDAHPVRRHQQARTRTFVVSVERQPAFVGLAINLIGNRTYSDLAHF
ncbi:hypothetical protein D3C76_1269680 [compost metagenome]